MVHSPSPVMRCTSSFRRVIRSPCPLRSTLMLPKIVSQQMGMWTRSGALLLSSWIGRVKSTKRLVLVRPTPQLAQPPRRSPWIRSRQSGSSGRAPNAVHEFVVYFVVSCPRSRSSSDRFDSDGAICSSHHGRQARRSQTYIDRHGS